MIKADSNFFIRLSLHHLKLKNGALEKTKENA